MLGQRKYIVVMNSETEMEEIFTFPMTIDHDAMFEAIYRAKNCTREYWTRNWRVAVSAGFVASNNECYGESISMNLKSRNEVDTLILKEG